ncbi:MAG: hypothetical protein PHU16_03995 [Atribacterota bacterium]|jgi:DNA-3-methyladenine glycosylase II|uniref:DNA-3-methyladenine glycosylase II n=1 Tax=Candidatus Atribacter allofermentans TaxID=1852833 RepID=A0A1V5SJA7_9BACT|nr:hypothetical protein [Atribacterota bacterium]OQA54323.1 MAG: DNA-3-methyladenine glycosylase [Candidatus Atribacteria bacterium ADurb.Bin276]
MQFTLEPPAPFTLKHLKRVCASRSDSSCLWMNDALYMVFVNINDVPILTKIEELGTSDQPILLITTPSEFDSIPNFSHLFSFRDDLKSFYQSVQTDPVMNRIVNQYYGTRIFHNRSFFESAVIAILEQQISVKAATKIRERFVNHFGRGPIQYDGMVFRAFPTAHDLFELSIDDIRLVGISMNKAKAIHNLAQCLVEGSFQVQSLFPQSKQLSIKKIMTLKGIGLWSAQYILTMGLAWNDIVAHGDLGLRKAISHYYKKGQPVSDDESQDFFKRFIPWRHMVGYYLLMDHIENGKKYVTSI